MFNSTFLKKVSCLLMVSCLVAQTLIGCGSKDSETTTKYCVAKQIYTATQLSQQVESDIYVEAIEGLSDDFIKGVDISTIIAQENSGVKYYNIDGEEEDIFKILADAGVNYIRVRVWNDPYDSDGNGYGGGNCDAQTAATIGKRAAEYGMKLLVDFHYSDFWADPAKQFAPKAWADKTADEKAELLYEYTKSALETILDAGANVGMVQLGNEINNGMSGETVWKEISKLLAKGIDAVNEVEADYGMDILTAIHLTNVDNLDKIKTITERLGNNGVDYDVCAFSYYSYWHGDYENLTAAMEFVHDTYGKKVMVAEFSWAYTGEDGDGQGNSISTGDETEGTTFSVQEQANIIHDVSELVSNIGEDGLGVFYWEPAWIPVNYIDWSLDNAEELYEANKTAWETYGSGWASSYSSDYDPNDAGVYYGGSSWDNQALFDFNGKALASLYTFAYLNYGSTTDLAVEFIETPEVEVNIGSALELPDTVYVHYNNRDENKELAVTWNEDEVSVIDTNVEGEYTVKGTLDDGTVVSCNITISLFNWVENPSFEDTDYSMYTITSDNSGSYPDYQTKGSDAYTGSVAVHFWDTSDMNFSIEQTVTGLENGTYEFTVMAQGGDIGEDDTFYIYAKVGDEIYTQEFTLAGYANWQTPVLVSIPVTDGEVTVGVSVSATAKAWGTFDDFYLYKVD